MPLTAVGTDKSDNLATRLAKCESKLEKAEKEVAIESKKLNNCVLSRSCGQRDRASLS